MCVCVCVCVCVGSGVFSTEADGSLTVKKNKKSAFSASNILLFSSEMQQIRGRGLTESEG